MPDGRYSLGVEEEYLVVDRDTRAPSPEGERLVADAADVLGERVHTELQLAQVEVSTEVCATLSEVRQELQRVRRELGQRADRAGLAIAAAGTHPFANWRRHGRITPSPVYDRLERDYQQLAREQLICGCHVHVGIEDDEEVVHVLNRVRPWLSPLVALAANSPFWMGADTGYASYRTEVWRRWPMASTPEAFADRAEYDRTVDVLLATGSIDDPGRLYLDVRPSARFATLEFRVTDVCLSVDEAVMIAGLIRALACTCHRRFLAGDAPPRPRPELLRAATWRAARHGLDADLVHVVDGRALPAAEMVAALLEFVQEALEEAGDRDEIDGLVDVTLGQGTGATRQRRAFEQAGRLEDVVDLVVGETASTSAFSA